MPGRSQGTARPWRFTTPSPKSHSHAGLVRKGFRVPRTGRDPERSILHVENARNIRDHGGNGGRQLPPPIHDLDSPSAVGGGTLTPSHPEAGPCTEVSDNCVQRGH